MGEWRDGETHEWMDGLDRVARRVTGRNGSATY